jgi:hypothetical protein
MPSEGDTFSRGRLRSLKLRQMALEAQIRVLGPNHEDTLESKEAVESWRNGSRRLRGTRMRGGAGHGPPA